MAQTRPLVGGLVAKESGNINSGGTINKYIDIMFQKPDDTILVEAEIWIREYSLDTAASIPEYSDMDWEFVGTTRDNRYRINDVKPNVKYEVAVIAIDNKGNKSDLTTLTVSTSGTIDTGSENGSGLKGSKITGLSILNRPGENTFIGRDCVFIWNKISFTGGDNNAAGTEVYGAGTITPQSTFRDYQIDMYNTSDVLLRTEYTSTETYTYTYEKNYQDNNGTVLSSFKITVRARDTLGNMTDPVSLIVTNAGPETPVGVTYRVGPGYIIITIPASQNTNIGSYRIYGSQTSGFTPSETNKLYEGTSNSATIAVTVAGLWYFVASVVDSFGVEIESYILTEIPITVRAWVEYDDLELELMKMSFQTISWAQYAIFDSFVDESKRHPTDPAPYPATIENNSLVAGGTEPSFNYQFTSKIFPDVTIIETGTGVAAGMNFTVSGAGYWTNQHKNVKLIDSAGSVFNVDSNTSDTFTLVYISGASAPVSGTYTLMDYDASYYVAFCSFEDETEGGGAGTVKMEVCFDANAAVPHWETVLDTIHSPNINSLQGTMTVDNFGNDYQVRFTLRTDPLGRSPKIKKYLVCTDPSPWRW